MRQRHLNLFGVTTQVVRHRFWWTATLASGRKLRARTAEAIEEKVCRATGGDALKSQPWLPDADR